MNKYLFTLVWRTFDSIRVSYHRPHHSDIKWIGEAAALAFFIDPGIWRRAHALHWRTRLQQDAGKTHLPTRPMTSSW